MLSYTDRDINLSSPNVNTASAICDNMFDYQSIMAPGAVLVAGMGQG